MDLNLVAPEIDLLRRNLRTANVIR